MSEDDETVRALEGAVDEACVPVLDEVTAPHIARDPRGAPRLSTPRIARDPEEIVRRLRADTRWKPRNEAVKLRDYRGT